MSQFKQYTYEDLKDILDQSQAGVSYKEIAKQYNRTPGAIYTLLHGHQLVKDGGDTQYLSKKMIEWSKQYLQSQKKPMIKVLAQEVVEEQTHNHVYEPELPVYEEVEKKEDIKMIKLIEKLDGSISDLKEAILELLSYQIEIARSQGYVQATEDFVNKQSPAPQEEEEITGNSFVDQLKRQILTPEE